MNCEELRANSEVTGTVRFQPTFFESPVYEPLLEAYAVLQEESYVPKPDRNSTYTLYRHT